MAKGVKPMMDIIKCEVCPHMYIYIPELTTYCLCYKCKKEADLEAAFRLAMTISTFTQY